MKITLAALVLLALCCRGPSHAASQERIPANAHKNLLGTGWECNRGFQQRGDSCVPVQIPANAQLDILGHGWECRRGYSQNGRTCEPVRIPANAHLDILGHGWECDRGFREQANGCVRVIVPAHAHLDVLGHGWECDANYKHQRDSCTPMSPGEIQEAQRTYRELAQRFAAQRRALEAVDWSSCNYELDRLRRRARDAADKATQVESAKSNYESCRARGTGDCSSDRSSYDSAVSSFAGELDGVMSSYKSVLNSCGGR
jgi:hypothetical protein